MTPAPFCAAVDWGTSSFRIWLLGEGGAVLGERRSREGMTTASEIGFEAVLEGHLAALGAPEGVPVAVCGMAGARQGWIEAPYVDAPAALAAIAAGAITVPGLRRDVRILPGVAQRAAGRPDVMRGEETILMGLPGEMDGLVCLPGTHSKWALVEHGRIEAFSTFMTGETFALLSGQSILRHSVAPDAAIPAGSPVFAAAVTEALASPGLTLNRLFSIRAAALFGESTPDDAVAALSGVIVGLEMAGVRTLHPEAEAVALASSGPLRDLYAAALGLAGFNVIDVDADVAVRRGLFAAAAQCFGHTETPS